MALHRYFKISVDLHLVLRSFAARRTCTLRKYKQQKDRGDHLRGFHLRRWQKATKPTGIAGPLSLAKKCLAWGKLATGSIFHRHEHSLKGVVNCRVLLTQKLKPRKFFSKTNTAFSRNFAPAKISHYTVCKCTHCLFSNIVHSHS